MAPAGNPPTQQVGPGFRSQDEKPSATVSVEVKFDNVRVLPQTPQLIALLSYVDAPESRGRDTEEIMQHDSQQGHRQSGLHLLF